MEEGLVARMHASPIYFKLCCFLSNRSGLFSFLDAYRKHLLQRFSLLSEWVESVSSQEQSATEGETSNHIVQSFIKSVLLAFQKSSPEPVPGMCDFFDVQTDTCTMCYAVEPRLSGE